MFLKYQKKVDLLVDLISCFVVLKNRKGALKNMYKCPKCGFQSENLGNCPIDNETLVAEMDSTPTPAQPESPAEPQSTPEAPETTLSENQPQ